MITRLKVPIEVKLSLLLKRWTHIHRQLQVYRQCNEPHWCCNFNYYCLSTSVCTCRRHSQPWSWTRLLKTSANCCWTLPSDATWRRSAPNCWQCVTKALNSEKNPIIFDRIIEFVQLCISNLALQETIALIYRSTGNAEHLLLKRTDVILLMRVDTTSQHAPADQESDAMTSFAPISQSCWLRIANLW